MQVSPNKQIIYESMIFLTSSIHHIFYTTNNLIFLNFDQIFKQ